MELIVDASVIFGFFFEDEMNDYTEFVFEQVTRQKNRILVPAVFPLEVANVVCQQEKKKRWTRNEVGTFLELLTRLSIRVAEQTHIHDIAKLGEVVKEYALTSYDASYLHLAMTKKLKLATQDKVLKEAAKKAGVFLEV